MLARARVNRQHESERVGRLRLSDAEDGSFMHHGRVYVCRPAVTTFRRKNGGFRDCGWWGERLRRFLLLHGTADVDDVVGDHAEPDPTLHSGLSAMPRPSGHINTGYS